MDLIKGIVRNSALVLLPAAAVSAFLPWDKLPASILVGGLLGILNIKALAWSIGGILGTAHANAKLLFVSQFRFVMVVIVVVALAALRLVTLPGLLVGFSVVFVQVLIVGLSQAKRRDD